MTADDPADAAALAGHAQQLAEAAEAAIPGWVERSVRHVLSIQRRAPDTVPDDVVAEAGRAAQADGGPRLHKLLATDVDAQRENPLSVLRSLVRYPTGILQAAGVSPIARDEFARRNFPDDLYDLTPAAFADVDPALHEPGLVWGAAKAHVHLARRRREGKR